jgi:cytosine deaminase
MCTGATLLHRIPRVVVGENVTFLGAERRLRSAGATVLLANDQRCIALMRAFIEAHPELWNEDIGVPPEGD